MKPLYRYGIIALCFVVFFVFGTVLVTYTTGEVYDWSTHRFVETGIISAATDPSGAQVYLNGVLAGTTPIRVRFLTPGNYDVKITKQGYGTWDKLLKVQGDFTTYVNPDISAVYLFKSPPAEQAVATGVQDFVASGNTFVYATANALVVASVGQPGSSTYSAPTGTSFVGAQLTASPSGQYVLIRTKASATVFYLGTKTFTVLPIAAPGSVEFTDDGSLYWLNNTSLGKITWQTVPVVTAPVAQNVLAFDVNAQGVYVVQKNQTGENALVFMQAPLLQQTVLRTELPGWPSATLYVNAGNQIFINADGELYAVNSGLNEIGSNVQSVLFYEHYGQVLLATGNEIDLYSTTSGSSQLIARTSTPISGAQATLSTATVFFIGGGSLQAIETDSRDHQNSYAFATVASGAKFYVTSDAKYIVLLDSGTLVQLQVR